MSKKESKQKIKKFASIAMVNGDHFITSLEQLQTIADSTGMIAIDRYTKLCRGKYEEINPIAINTDYVVDGIRIDGIVTTLQALYKKDSDKND